MLRKVTVVEYDEAIYLNISRTIQRTGLPYRTMDGGILYADHTPLFRYFQGVGAILWGQNLLLHKLIAIGFGVWTIGLVGWIGRKLRNWETGWGAMALLSVTPFFVLYAGFVREEVPMAWGCVATIACLILYEETNKRRWLILAGLCAACAVMFKELAILFLGSAGLYVLFSPNQWFQKITDAVLLGLPTGIALIVWGVIVWVVAPDVLSSTVERYVNSAAGTGASTVDFRTGIGIVPWLRTVGGGVVGWLNVGLLGIGLVVGVLRRDVPRMMRLVMIYLGVAVGISVVISLKEPRHLMAIVPCVVLLASVLIDWGVLWETVGQNRLTLFVFLIGAVVLLGSLSPLRLPRTDFHLPESYWDQAFAVRMYGDERFYGVFKEVGAFLAERTASDEVVTVVHQGPVAGYYADRPYTFLYTKNKKQVDRVLDRTEWLVYDAPTFLQLSENEVAEVDARITQEFVLAGEVESLGRKVLIYQRR